MEDVIKEIIEGLEDYRFNFVEQIYDEFTDEPDNTRANSIIDSFDEIFNIINEVGKRHGIEQNE